MLPIKWRLEGLQALYDLKCFKVSKTEGVMNPYDTEKVKFTFEPTDPKEYDCEIKLVISDLDDLCTNIPPLPMKVTAESYNITYEVLTLAPEP